MRLYLAVGIFLLSVLAAACGGGGKSGLPPVSIMPTSGIPAPTNAKARRLGITMHIPPAAQQAQSATKRPFYISPNTLSFAIAAVPNGSTPQPSQIQVFPVTTPSPCATVSAGGETCTFVVQAPIGTDQFYMASFAVASPIPGTSTPLSTFVSGAVVIGGSPGPSPTPLAFTLNGVVNSVTVTVPSPDPGNTPNTQLFTVEVAATTAPLAITPYDASGNAIMSDAFSSPITFNITPANQGVSLVLTNPTCPTSSTTSRRRMQTGSPTISIGCPSDLGAVTVAYDGSVYPDSQDHIVDTFAVTADASPSPIPSPANFVLMGNFQTYTPNSGGTAYTQAYLQSLSNNVVGFLLNGPALTTAAYGTINVNTGAVSTPIALTGVSGGPTAGAFYVMSDGTIWVADNSSNNSLECFNGTTGALVTSYSLASTAITAVNSVIYDGTDIWIAGNLDTTDGVAYAPLTASCTIGSLLDITLSGDISVDPGLRLAPMSGGGVAVEGQQNGGFWTVTTGGGSTPHSPGFTPGSGEGGGIAIDGSSNIYGLFNNGASAFLSIFKSGALTQLATLPPLNLGGAMGALAAFGPNNTAADRMAFAISTYSAIGGILNPNSGSPIFEVFPIPGASNIDITGQNAAFSTLGADFLGYENSSTSAVTVGRILLTSSWTVPQAYLGTPINLGNLGNPPIFSIAERGDSGPFTATAVGTGVPSGCFGGVNAVAGFDHIFQLSAPLTDPCTATLTITDKNGRSQTASFTYSYAP